MNRFCGLTVPKSLQTSAKTTAKQYEHCLPYLASEHHRLEEATHE
jgi:hypothetical protein